MHCILQGSQCHRLTEKGGSRSETLMYASPLYIVGNTQLANNDYIYYHFSWNYVYVGMTSDTCHVTVASVGLPVTGISFVAG